MTRLGEALTDNNLIEKFITAVQEGDGNLYSSVVRGYNREMVMGRSQTIEQLLELMSIEFRLAEHAPTDSEAMVGLSSVEQCSHCAKDCWDKYPNKRVGRNTVLNEAYILTAHPAAYGYFRHHVGDDVYIRAPSTLLGGKMLKDCREAGLRVNPTKQSFGIHTMEFLRVAGSSREAHGYFARAVSSAVSGSWDVCDRVVGLPSLMKYSHVSWTLRNRSGTEEIWELLVKRACSMSRIKRETVRLVLLHSVGACEGLLVRKPKTYYQYLKTDCENGTGHIGLRERFGRLWRCTKEANATTDYLSKHVVNCPGEANFGVVICGKKSPCLLKNIELLRKHDTATWSRRTVKKKQKKQYICTFTSN